MIQRIAITPGEPAGIGPDICIALAQQPPVDIELVVVADRELLVNRAAALNLALALTDFDASRPAEASTGGSLSLIQVDASQPVVAGQLNAANSGYVLDTLRTAVDAITAGQLDALVTGPVHKAVINDGGYPFSGHTEFLAQYCQQPLTVMMLATGESREDRNTQASRELRVALATTHIPLAEVAAAITPESLGAVIEILHRDLQSRFGIAQPRILVCGLNPHAGEGGHLGREEIETIAPVLQKFRDSGMDIRGPLPADTVFTPKYLEHADVVLAMYHDQGLPVLKYKGFGQAANITLGLPLVRTSVDHGTALELAGTGEADAGSLRVAIATAADMVRHGLGQSQTGAKP